MNEVATENAERTWDGSLWAVSARILRLLRDEKIVRVADDEQPTRRTDHEPDNIYNQRTDDTRAGSRAGTSKGRTS